MANPDNMKFIVTWLDYERLPCGEETISKYDLTAAIKWAANKVVKHPEAHGFHVERDPT